MAHSTLKQLHPLESLGNAPAKSGEIRIERLEDRLQPRVPFPHRHDFYHLLFLERGSGWHEIDFSRHTVTPNQLFIMRPGEVHSWNLGAYTRGYVLEFTRASLSKDKTTDELFSLLDELTSMILPAHPECFRSHLQLMHAEFSAAQSGFRLGLEYMLSAFLVKLVRLEAIRKKNKRASPLAERFLVLVEKKFQQEHKVEFYAKELKITPKALTQKISKILGVSAGTVIQERVLVEAKRMLSYTNQSVADIGYDLGYEDPNYFARFFRQHVGMAPGKYRSLANHTIRA